MSRAEERMAKQVKKLICPKCGDEMNHHADKIVEPINREDIKKVDPVLGGVLQESHCCPGCGAIEWRVADSILGAR
jgi:hypothetical protein